MALTRRGFLGALAAAGAATATGPASALVVQKDERFILRGKHLILDKPLDLRGLTDFLIEHCHIQASARFPAGEGLIRIDMNGSGSFCHNTLIATT